MNPEREQRRQEIRDRLMLEGEIEQIIRRVSEVEYDSQGCLYSHCDARDLAEELVNTYEMRKR